MELLLLCYFYTPYSDVTIGGDGTLTIIDNEFGISKGVYVDSLHITDSASLVIDITQVNNYSYVINAVNGFNTKTQQTKLKSEMAPYIAGLRDKSEAAIKWDPDVVNALFEIIK